MLNQCKLTCTNAVITAIKLAYQSRILGFYEDPSKGLVVLANTERPTYSQGSDETILNRQYDSGLTHVTEGRIVLKGEPAFGAASTLSQPQSPWSALAHKLLAEPSNLNWTMMRTRRGAGGFFALIGEQADRDARVLISGVVKSNGSVCVRSESYGRLVRDLNSDWADNSPGLRGGGISPSALQAIRDSVDGMVVLEALSDPQESNETYRLSPVLWMGDPEKLENCRWD
jgi:hypothetical protein